MTRAKRERVGRKVGRWQEGTGKQGNRDRKKAHTHRDHLETKLPEDLGLVVRHIVPAPAREEERKEESEGMEGWFRKKERNSRKQGRHEGQKLDNILNYIYIIYVRNIK